MSQLAFNLSTVAMETYNDVVEKYEDLFDLADRVVDVHEYLVDHVGTKSLVTIAAGQDHVQCPVQSSVIDLLECKDQLKEQTNENK